jgi:hypothetical protein
MWDGHHASVDRATSTIGETVPPSAGGTGAEGVGRPPFAAVVESFTDLRATYTLTEARKSEKRKYRTRTGTKIQKEQRRPNVPGRTLPGGHLLRNHC